MVVDFDDFTEECNRLDLLKALREINPKFKCTVFAIPAQGSEEFWRSIPEWIEIAVHGWRHPDPREAEDWTYSEASFVLSYCKDLFTHGFKAPGWQISDATYYACLDLGWWVADHWENDARRPAGVLTHRIAPDYMLTSSHWHGHIPDVCGNGISETWPALTKRVEEATSFEFVSEKVKPW